MLRHRRMGLLVLAGSALLAFAAAPRMLAQSSVRSRNALVARADRAVGAVPAECEQGLSATPALHVDVAEIPVPEVEPASVQAPPSSALRAALQQTQLALTRNDRPAFNDALQDAHSLLTNYPTGAERRIAEEVVRLHDAAAKLWDAQYESPFFDETDPLYATVSAWPGYAEAVRRSGLTDRRGHRFYPTAESRDFVTRLAGERLQRLGMQPTTRVTRETPRSTPPTMATSRTNSDRSSSARPSTSRSSTSRSSTSQSGTSRSTTPRTTAARTTTPRTTPSRSATPHTTTSRATTPPSTRTPATRIASATPRPTPKPEKPAPVTPTPSYPNPSASPTTAAAPAPVPAGVSQSNPDTAPAPVAGDVPSATATTATASTETMDSTTPATDTATTLVDTALSTDVIPGTPQPVRGRSVILPTILILIGLGVLIVLFRASK